jgi:branched-chain amino acid transport system permease protein
MTVAIASRTPSRSLRALALAGAGAVVLSVLLIALDAWWPWFHGNRWSVAQQAIIGLTNGLIIALVALGYTMVYGIIELINFAHGDLVMLGAFLALTLIGACGLEAHPGLGLGLLLVAVPAFCAALNWGVERLAYRPIREAPKLTALVTAIGVSFVFVNLGLFWGGAPMAVFDGGHAASAAKSVPDLVPPDNLLGRDSPVLLTLKDLLVALVTVPLMLGLTAFVKLTRLGTAMRATAQNPTAARLMGIDVDRVIGATFIIGGALGGVAAVVYALYNNSIGFQMGYRVGMDAFTAAVLGGIGNLPGAVLGGIVIGLVRAGCDGFFSSEWTNAVVFAVLILTLVFRPSGLLGAHVREKV